MLEARERGVIFDIGHGNSSFAWKTARAVMAGFPPDAISSDVHPLCINDPAFDQVMTMSKLLCLGMRLNDIVAKSTVMPARTLRREELGTFKAGSAGDATGLSLHDGESKLEDVLGEYVTGRQRIVSESIVVGGALVARTLTSKGLPGGRVMTIGLGESYGNYIGGAWVAETGTMTALNPATGESIATLPESSRATARRAIAAARQAQLAWAARTAFERAAVCERIATEIDARRDVIARVLSLEQGKPTSEASGEASKAADGFRLAAQLATQVRGATIPAEDPRKLVMTIRQPRGVYAVVTPWNFPVNIPVEYLAPGIATGNTIVWVPAPTTSLCAVVLMQAIEAAGLPPGVINLVMGEGPEVGDEIVNHPDTNAVGFTGSAATGKRIAERGAGKPMLLELGGNGPVIVFEDAAIERAAVAAAGGAFFNAGQVCAATGRALVHSSVADAFSRRVAEIARDIKLGDPLQQGTTMGPLNNAKVAAKVREHVDEAVAAGAVLLAGGKPRPDLGSALFYEPTVLTGVTRSMRINREETFGPVLPILTFETEAEALDLALDSDYGLSVGVFTEDISRAMRVAEAIPAGIVNVNSGSTYWELHLPFGGGSGTKSGVGRLGGMLTLEAMTEIKMISIQRG